MIQIQSVIVSEEKTGKCWEFGRWGWQQSASGRGERAGEGRGGKQIVTSSEGQRHGGVKRRMNIRYLRGWGRMKEWKQLENMQVLRAVCLSNNPIKLVGRQWMEVFKEETWGLWTWVPVSCVLGFGRVRFLQSHQVHRDHQSFISPGRVVCSGLLSLVHSLMVLSCFRLLSKCLSFSCVLLQHSWQKINCHLLQRWLKHTEW